MVLVKNKRKTPKQKDEEENDGDEAVEEELEGNENDLEDQFEAALHARTTNTWMNGGVKKDVVIRGLIQCFGSMIESFPSPDSIPDYRGRYRHEDMMHHKLLDASKQVVKAKRMLLENENFDTRQFTIFISKKKWIANILRPLLELCAKEDTALAMHCCSLALVLIKKISDTTSKKLKAILGKKKKNKPTTDEVGSDTETEDKNVILNNAKDQILALLSFKEALCSEKANEAVINAFKHYWLLEQEIIAQGMYLDASRQTKLSVAICLSYFRRILSISPHPQWSTANELLTHKSIHNKYIIQLRVILSLIPGIVSDLGVKEKSRYHDDWLIDIILILFHIVQSFDPQDLFLVWKSNSLMDNFATLLPSSTESTAATVDEPSELAKGDKSSARNALKEVVIPKTLATATKKQLMNAKGSLSEALSMERNARLNQQLMSSSRFSRFGSTYRLPVKGYASADPIPEVAPPSMPTTTTAITAGNKTSSAVPAVGVSAANPITGVETEENLGRAITSSAMLWKNPFQQAGTSIPQAKTKRNKKNITCAKENPLLDTSINQSKITQESQQASVVVASLVDRLTDEACLKSFIRRINEDLRRDEMRISPEMELNYFLIVAKLLHYNRLKLEDQYQKHLAEKQRREKEAFTTLSTAAAAPAPTWEPNLRNIMDILDKMSFTRVTVALERCIKNEALFDSVWIPMTLYLEMVCYLRLLLTSDLEGHHEIAIGALNRLFYTTTEKLDPLFKLFSAWKPGTYPRKHLHLLIQLHHETMKTLEAARNLFHQRGIDNEDALKLHQAKKRKQYDKKKDQKSLRREMDMEQYLLASMRFNIDDYFRRFVNYHNLDLYLRLLQEIDRNPVEIHTCMSVFFERLLNFRLENLMESYSSTGADRDDDDDPLSFSAFRAAFPKDQPVNLSYLLFNLRWLVTIETVLNHPQLSQLIKYDTSLAKIVSFLKKLVRSFGELSRKNHLLFVEALFHHSRAQEHTVQMESVYEATSYARREIMAGVDAQREQKLVGKKAPWEEAETSAASVSSSSDSESDLGDELDVDALPMSSKKVPAVDDPKKKDKKKKSRVSRKRSISDDSSSDSDLERENRRDKVQTRRSKASFIPWTNEEDEQLKKYYQKYVGSSTIFENIQREFGNSRNADQIGRRVGELQLHLQVYDSDDEEMPKEEMDQVKADPSLLATPQTQPQFQIPLSDKSEESVLNTTKESPFYSKKAELSSSSPATERQVFWDVTAEDVKQLEQRSLGLAFSDEEGEGVLSSGRKKRSLKKVKGREEKRQKLMTSMISDEEDNFFDDEPTLKQPMPALTEGEMDNSQATFPTYNLKITARSEIDSDDD